MFDKKTSADESSMSQENSKASKAWRQSKHEDTQGTRDTQDKDTFLKILWIFSEASRVPQFSWKRAFYHLIYL